MSVQKNNRSCINTGHLLPIQEERNPQIDKWTHILQIFVSYLSMTNIVKELTMHLVAS